jgi:polyribonucleotide nucleotidyltransferase
MPNKKLKITLFLGIFAIFLPIYYFTVNDNIYNYFKDEIQIEEKLLQAVESGSIQEIKMILSKNPEPCDPRSQQAVRLAYQNENKEIYLLLQLNGIRFCSRYFPMMTHK